MVKTRSGGVAQFWHIPWPNPEAFRICPWEVEILEGLLGNDLMGFHIRYHCKNFLETVNRELECLIDHERSAAVGKEKITLVRPFPISVGFDLLSVDSQREEVDRTTQGVKKKMGAP